jgi:MFS family permease
VTARDRLTIDSAVAYVVFSSVAGSVVAPIVGGVIETYMDWRWIFMIQVLFGAVAQAIHFFVPETRATIMLDNEASRLRKTGEDPNAWGPNEVRGSFWKRINLKDVATLMWRPYKFLLTEPIVLFLSLLSGFSDALIFTGLDSFPMVLQLWKFSKIAIGLSFISLLVGYLVAYFTFLPVYRRDRKVLRENPKAFSPERRLWLLLFLVVLEPIGLVGFGFGSYGPPEVHWMLPLFFAGLIGIANFAIYMATIDYMVAAYGPYSASATGGNGFCRDLLAGVAALYTRPFYSNILTGTKYQLAAAIWISCGIGALLCIPVYVFYFKGEWFRKKSKYAQELAQEREEVRLQSAPNSRANSMELDTIHV